MTARAADDLARDAADACRWPGLAAPRVLPTSRPPGSSWAPRGRWRRCAAVRTISAGTLMNESISRAAGNEHGQELPPRGNGRADRQSAGRVPLQRTTLYGPVTQDCRARAYAAPPFAPIVLTRRSGASARGRARKRRGVTIPRRRPAR